MMKAKRFFLFVFIMAAALSAPARAGMPGPGPCACTPADFGSRWKEADAVFAGTVTDIRTVEKFAKKNGADRPIEVTLRVDENYKGAPDKTFVIDTSFTHYTCTGYPFEQGKQYLVFAYVRSDGEYEPRSLYRYAIGTYDVGGACGGTREFLQAGDDVKEIAKVLKSESIPGLLGKYLGKP